MTRTRTLSWDDPVEAAQAAAEMSGLEALQAIMDGRLPPPPIALLMGFEPVEASEGRAVFAATPGEEHYNPIGAVHGGFAMTLLDSAMGCAVQTTLPPGVGFTSLEVKTNFTRSITRDTGQVVCEATVVHRGRTIATAEGTIVEATTGKLLAHATTTCLILER